MKTITLILALLMPNIGLAEKTHASPREPLNHLFASGDDGYKSYRIPALVRTTKGTLLAFCEGRVHGAGDHGDIDVVMKRSTDNGATWSALHVVHDYENHCAGNPVPIVDRKSGRVFLVSCRSSVHEGALLSGKGRRGIVIQHSDDDGKTWTEPRDISQNIYPKNWGWYATGPCSGIQIIEGKHAGRLVVPANHSVLENGRSVYRAHSIYSDDLGKTWHLGESSAPGGNESQIAEVKKDLLYQTIRMQTHTKGIRAYRYSKDGGETWSDLKHDASLPCPRCQGSVIRDYSQPERLIFSNPGTKNGRNGMTIRMSNDGGKTWPFAKLVLPTSSAYSDLAITSNNDVAILYEGGHHAYASEGIVFSVYTKKELINSKQVAGDAINAERPALLPMPQSVQWGDRAIEIDAVKTTVPPGGDELLKKAQLRVELVSLLEKNNMKSNCESNFEVRLQYGKVAVPGYWKGQGQEAYSLVADAKGVVVTANDQRGLFYGLQTLKQLIVRIDGKTTIAACNITDYPAFKVRGFMHDVGRNFQSLDQLKMQIDIMAAYKMNVFHFHLTEYHGWRLESKIYPNLQADSSFMRKPGKYYTQKEFVELVDYCWARGITVIPEFDSPGHSDAFRKGVGVKTMRDPKAKAAMVQLIDELCALVPKEKMPYVHLGTDEVRHACERVGPDYLPVLHKAVHDNGREVIGWWKGMRVNGDKRQIFQTWAQSQPVKGMRHIDSRSNYVNHVEALDFATRMFFQQPCRAPHGDAMNLGGILCYWPDNKVDDEKLTLTNNPVIPAMVAYSEAVWKGVRRNHTSYWAKLPAVGTKEFSEYADFENRLAEHRDRFMHAVPFPYVKTHPIEWRLLGPVADGEVQALEEGVIKDIYHENDDVYRWTKPLRGGAIHVKHFFGFPGHLKTFRKGKDVVWANTFIYSEKAQTVDAWISFNTTSSSDNRAGVAKAGNWNANPKCNIWINDKRVEPPRWKNPGKMGKEFAFTNEIYTSRLPTKIKLKKGWNKVLIKSSPSWKWVISFSPVDLSGEGIKEVHGLKYSATGTGG